MGTAPRGSRAWRAYTLERDRLADSFARCDPDDEVACAGWTATDLLAHLVAQDRWRGLPLLAATPVVAALPAGPRDVVRRWLLERPEDRMKRRLSYDEMLGRLRRAPPLPFRVPGLVLTRLVEVWVHHEDLRRPHGAAPRPSDDDLDSALWAATRLISSRVTLPEGVGLTLRGPTILRRRPDAPEQVVATGSPGELLLVAMGRGGLSAARFDGDPATIRALVTARLV